MPSALYLLAAANSEAASSGNPLVDLAHQFGLDWPMLVAQIVSFSAVAYILYRAAFKPVLETLDERKSKIESGLAYAEEMKAKLADAENQHKEAIRKASEEAKQIVEEAREIAEKKISESAQQAIQVAEDISKKAETQIELDRKQMLSEARNEIARLVVATASKVLSKELSADDKNRFAESASANLVDSAN